jgi:hypothetical protein
MNASGQIALRQRVGRLCVQVTAHVATFTLAAVLVAAWVLTGPLFQLSDSVAELLKRRKSAAGKGEL